MIPLLDEAEVFTRLLERVDALVASLASNTRITSEVILIDDGSTDGTAELVRQACARPGAAGKYRGVVLSRNFGHQPAITAGMHFARGQAVAVLDGDLQDPPEVIAEFYARLCGDGQAQDGAEPAKKRFAFDVVYAVRRDRKENIFKRVAYAGFYRLMRRLANVPIPLDSGDFCIMSRRVVDQINAMRERHRFIRGLRSWVGFRQTAHGYPRAAREAGKSKYTFGKLTKLALDGLFTFSEKPLQWSAQFGLLVAMCSVAYAVYVLIWRLFAKEAVPGFAALAVGLFFLGGVQLMSIGILGEYIGRIHNEVKGRPHFIVAEKYGFDGAREVECSRPIEQLHTGE